MKPVMIALVSEQRMQNIIPLFQQGADYERLWLIRSTDADQPNSRFARAWQDTSETLSSHLVVHSAEPSVSAYGIAETQESVTNLIGKEPPGAVVINFTGGTKCMSIGAYLAAQEAQLTALYVDTANEKLVWFHPDGEIQEEPFDLAGRLTVAVYLQANAKRIDEGCTRHYALPKRAFAAAWELAAFWPRGMGTLEIIGEVISRGQDWVSNDQVDSEIASLLAEYGFIQRGHDGWQVAQRGRAFLNGKWLDAVVCVLLGESQLFDDVAPNLRLEGVENELDVLATRRGQLAIIECKSGDLGGQTTLNRLQAIRTGFGTFARTFFVTNRMEGQVDQPFRERAREYGVRDIITAESLLQVASKVREKMRGTP